MGDIMKKTAVNPFLPEGEYIPDGEPHVFGDRVYIFGSHDRFGGARFCMNDYVCYSAPVGDLTDWRLEGEIYSRTQDPDNADGKYELWAPDVVQGPDGKYYLYYCLSDRPAIGVAVCDTPAGQYRFLGHVKDASGAKIGSREGDTLPFDPAVLVEGGKIWLYSGNGPMNAGQDKKKQKAQTVAELDRDMMTVISGPEPLIPTVHTSAGTSFEGHEFFEGSSIRKFDGRYYFIYSSVQLHLLCWAVSDRPDSGFVYGGALVSNGDVPESEKIDTGFNAKPDLRVKYYIGNNHGSVEKIGDRYYVFYHRQTNRRMSSRQACAEEICFENGKFRQARMSSCGLNGGPLPDSGTYGAYTACHLQSKKGAVFSAHPLIQNKKHPAITQVGADGEEGAFQIVENMRDGSSAGYRSFLFKGAGEITVRVRGKAKGVLEVLDEENGSKVAELAIAPSKEWHVVSSKLTAKDGVSPLYFVYHGKGSIDMMSFTIKQKLDGIRAGSRI